MHTMNLEAIGRSEYPAVIRLAAHRLATVSYTTVGAFLRGLTDADLAELIGYCKNVTDKSGSLDALDNLVLLGEMLAQAEGLELDGPDITRASNLIILLNFEDLARKGIISFYRENATLGTDLQFIKIAEYKK